MKVIHLPGAVSCGLQHCERCGLVVGGCMPNPLGLPERTWTEGVPLVQTSSGKWWSAGEAEPDCQEYLGPVSECYLWRPIPDDAPEPDEATLEQVGRMVASEHVRAMGHRPLHPPQVKALHDPSTWSEIDGINVAMGDQMRAVLRDNPKGLVFVAMICAGR